MLNKLFGSNARVKILKLFLLNPDKKYYIRQLARDLKLQVNSVRRELENLEQFGLLVSDIGREDGEDMRQALEKENKEFEDLVNGKVISGSDSKKKSENKKNNLSARQEKKYYQTNKNFVLYEEIKSLILKSQVLYEQDFVDKIRKIGRPQLLVLTGFFVNDKSSNVDILAAGNIPKNKFTKIIKDLEKEVGRELNYVLMDNKELQYRREMTDVFLFSIIEGRRVVVVDELGIGS